MKSNSRKQAMNRQRRQKHADARKAKAKPAKKSSPFASWLGDRRPVIAPKSHEQMLVRLEERGLIEPRAVRMDAYHAKHRIQSPSGLEQAA